MEKNEEKRNDSEAVGSKVWNYNDQVDEKEVYLGDIIGNERTLNFGCMQNPLKSSNLDYLLEFV